MNYFLKLSSGVVSLISLFLFSISASAQTVNCPADQSWFTSPSMPLEVAQSAGPGDSTFCDFYQFTWQAFAYLMATSSNDSSVRNFQDQKQFHELEASSDGTPENSCDKKVKGETFFVRTVKSSDAGEDFAIPERINQAGGGATIYDQNSNVVYYNVRFTPNLCDVKSIQSNNNFPGKTTELKSAWKVLKSGEEANYVTFKTKLGKQKTVTTLGLIGFHIAAATPDHPEFVWATFEHNNNSPDCVAPAKTTGFAFSSESCATALKNNDNVGIINCQFNDAQTQNDLSQTTGSPTNICREYPYGSKKGDAHYDENVSSITSLNKNVQPFLTGQYSVLKNYFNVGALWVSDTSQGSTIGNQRGSLRLANTVAETDFQSVDLNSQFISNCFGCHSYSSGTTKNTTNGFLSHIFDDIVAGSGQCVDVQASKLINSNSQAKQDCPNVCTNSSSQFKWNGQWTNQGVPMSVCGCCGK